MRRSSLRTALITTTALTAALLFIGLPTTAATAQIATGGGAGGNTFGASGGAGGIAGGGGGAGAEDGVPGGNGGNAATSFTGSASGGGGSNGATDGGPAGSPNDVSAGGGGGGSSSGGTGGAGGAGGQVGDAGALPASFTGNNGLPAGTAGDKDGGGGGGGAGLVWTDPTNSLEIGSQTVQGGSGGDGASGGAGGGGGGGAGLVVESNVTVHLSSGGQINGGTGGAAFNANSASGSGGAGIFMFNGGTFTNDGGAVKGGDAGSFISTVGNGGAGFLGNGATVNNNSGSITGGDGAVPGAGAEIYGGTITNGAAGTITGGNIVSVVGPSGQGILALSGSAVTVTNFGTIAGGGGFGGGVGVEIDADDSILVNAGIINGGSGLGNTANAVLLTGANDRLELQNGYQFTGNVVATGASATLAFGGTDNASFDVSQIGSTSQFQGFSSLDKSGTSTWTLTGTSTFTGPMTVSGGTLLVNGDTRTFSQMTVNAGATLGGSGTISNAIINSSGTFAPGDGTTPGTVTTVLGNLSLQSGAIYMVQIDPSAASSASVGGTANLGGATVNAAFASGSYVNKQYTILSAGSVNGTFSGLVNTNLPTNFTSALSYVGNNVYLNLTLNFTAPSGGGGTSGGGSSGLFGSGLNLNQQHIANVLENFFNANGGIPMAFGALTPQGLTQAAGETATGAQQTTFDAMNLFMGLMSDPTEHGTTPAPSSPYQAYAAMPTKAVPLQPAFAPGWSTWASGFGGSQTTTGNSATGSNDVTSRIFGGAAGADYHLAPDTLLGFALTGGGTNFSVANGGTGRSDLFQAGAFGRQNFGAGYVSAALAYGWQDITTDRYVIGNHLHAQFDANSYSGRIEGGYRFALPNMAGLGLTPYAATQVTVFDLPAYAEQAIGGGVFALNYASKDVTDTRSELGLRADKSFVVGDAILTLRGRAAWAHDFDTDRSVSATFQTLPGASFVVNGAAMAPDSALVSASAETTWRNGWSVAATFDGEFSDVTASYAAKGVVRYAW